MQAATQMHANRVNIIHLSLANLIFNYNIYFVAIRNVKDYCIK